MDDALVPPDPLVLIHITEAYNRHEITYEQWLQQTKDWAEAVVRYYGRTHSLMRSTASD